MKAILRLALLLWSANLISCLSEPKPAAAPKPSILTAAPRTIARTTTEPYTGPNEDINAFFYEWLEYQEPPVYLTERQASWWYTVGEYRPRRYDYEELRYPRPVYYEDPPYVYPPYGSSGSVGQCRCDHIPGPERIRREFREMDSTMRANYVNAVLALVAYIPDPVGAPSTSAYDIFVLFHQWMNSPGAHGGAAFYGFHREYLWRFENALTLHGSYPEHQGLPYWDSTLDSSLPNPSASVMFTSSFMGNNQGLLGAPFAGMSVPSVCGGTVNRNAPNSGFAQFLFNEQDVTDLMDQTCFAHLTQNLAWTCPGGPCNFEQRHGGPHVWVGGDMANLCSPSDPIFWQHHAFIDCLWEDFRQNAQITEPETEYPLSFHGGPPHDWNAPMSPFVGLMNAHGLSNHYTNYYYKCAPRPSGVSCENDADCNPLDDTNPALWCDNGRCRSKIQQEGNCLRAGVNLPDNACWCLSGVPYCAYGICGCQVYPG